MTYDYDALYAEHPNALGEPTKVFVDFFARLNQPNARVLDVGCGQGRDTLFIARLGHHVVGVDLAPHGIEDMLAVAQKECLHIQGKVADIADFTPEGTFDVVVIDRTLHMLETKARLDTLARLLGYVAPKGWLLIEDERANIAGFKAVITADTRDWTVKIEKRGTYFLQQA